MSRKIIQISACQSEDGHARVVNCFALCNDGSLWAFSPVFTGTAVVEGWQRVPEIPQGDSE
jgi:hypothetical protein